MMGQRFSSVVLGFDDAHMREHLEREFGEDIARVALHNRTAIRNMAAGVVTAPEFDLTPRRTPTRAPERKVEPFGSYSGPWTFEAGMDLGRKASVLWNKPETLLAQLPIELEETGKEWIEARGNNNYVMGRSFLPPGDKPKIQIANVDGVLRQFVVAHELAHHFFPQLSRNAITADAGETFCSGVAAGWLNGRVTG